MFLIRCIRCMGAPEKNGRRENSAGPRGMCHKRPGHSNGGWALRRTGVRPGLFPAVFHAEESVHVHGDHAVIVEFPVQIADRGQQPAQNPFIKVKVFFIFSPNNNLLNSIVILSSGIFLSKDF